MVLESKLARDGRVMAVDVLSRSKRKYIENWRQNVSVYMENGNICRVTIAEVTPEPTVDFFIKKASTEHAKAISDMSNSPHVDRASPTLPVVKFSYCHAANDKARQQKKTKLTRKYSEKYDKYSNSSSNQRTIVLPPSPNGVVIQSGLDSTDYTRKPPVLKTVETHVIESELPDVNDPKDFQRKSSKTAREMYEKYNMKSQTHNMLSNRKQGMDTDQYSMPWRNKTFLSLPMRFNPTAQRRSSLSNQFCRERTYLTDVVDDISEPEDDYHEFNKDWNHTFDW